MKKIDWKKPFGFSCKVYDRTRTREVHVWLSAPARRAEVIVTLAQPRVVRKEGNA
jgi:hypothetical protein